MNEYVIEKTATDQNIRVLSDFAENALRDLHIPENPRQELIMAMDEAVTNIVSYAYGAEKGKIRLEIGHEGECLKLEIVDQGKEFDPTTHPEPDLNVPIEDRPAGGMGIELARKLTDRMRYFRENGDNHLVLIKKIGEKNG